MDCSLVQEPKALVLFRYKDQQERLEMAAIIYLQLKLKVTCHHEGLIQLIGGNLEAIQTLAELVIVLLVRL